MTTKSCWPVSTQDDTTAQGALVREKGLLRDALLREDGAKKTAVIGAQAQTIDAHQGTIDAQARTIEAQRAEVERLTRASEERQKLGWWDRLWGKG